MTTTTPPIHGLSYNPAFLQSLRVLTPRPSPHQPIRLLPLSSFADIHLKSLLNHAPDNVLFPFLHGLEGSNQAQNMFFQMSGGYPRGGNPNGNASAGNVSVVPRFRGLIWVVCEEDLDDFAAAAAAKGVLEGHALALTHAQDNTEEERYADSMDLEEELDDDFYSSEESAEADDGLSIGMECDAVDVMAEFAMDVDVHDETEGQIAGEAHMHPVHHRTPGPGPVPPLLSSQGTTPTSSPNVDIKTSLSLAPSISTTPPTSTIPITTSPPSEDPSITTTTITGITNTHDRRPSNASSIASFASTNTDGTDATDTFSVSTSATSFAFGSGSGCTSPTSVQGSVQQQQQPSQQQQQLQSQSQSPQQSQQKKDKKKSKKSKNPTSNEATGPPPLPLLTSTFRPKDLLRATIEGFGFGISPGGGGGEPEFVPPRVPSGISLRNFGIQVPIYATLSDIVIYSPKGLTRASMALAERFKVAVERKVGERREKMRGTNTTTGGNEGEGEDDDGLIAYNVFVLDATAEEMMETVPHLMVRLQGASNHNNHNNSSSSPSSPTAADLDDPESEEEIESDNNAHTIGQDGQTTGEKGSSAEDKALKPNTIDFALREKEEMRDLTRASEIISIVPLAPAASSLKEGVVSVGAPSVDFSGTTTASHWDPNIGQVFLGNSNDVPLVPDLHLNVVPNSRRIYVANHSNTSSSNHSSNDNVTNEQDDAFSYKATNDPAKGFGYDVCIECHEVAPFPSTAHLRAADEHLQMLDAIWAQRHGAIGEAGGDVELPVRPPPNANAIIHLPFPSSPPSTAAAVASLLPFVKFLERLLQPVPPPDPAVGVAPNSNNANNNANNSNGNNNNLTSHSRRWSSVSSLMPSFPSPSYQGMRSRSSTTPSSIASRLHRRTRPLKVLIYSPDGYTESSVPAICLLMAIRGLSLPEAYLELQVVKKRSFFVYQNDLGVLRRVEGRLLSEREQERARGVSSSSLSRPGFGAAGSGVGVVRSGSSGSSIGRQNGWARFSHYGMNGNEGYTRPSYHSGGRPAANSISIPSPAQTYYTSLSPSSASASSFGEYQLNSESSSSSSPLPPSPPPMIVPSQNHLVKSRPRASTSPWLPSLFEDHQSWFNDPRFDGSFPSRVLPFLYLGNLNHASNAYMLHALGITHVVSVGECALVPPPHHEGDAGGASCSRPVRSGAHFVAGKGPGGQGSLWIEEREGRIKVLDIQGVCDDGIDTLEPQLEPICEWIEKARRERGQVLVHCRVGVSRSATVTIAYVMKHLGLPLVDAYLIVRSRRLSVLIQPNMRLLYNLCGWEVKLARERAGDDEEQLKYELARTLSWPYLAREVHSLNEKYLH